VLSLHQGVRICLGKKLKKLHKKNLTDYYPSSFTSDNESSGAYYLL
jgi:hypothetical protein